MQHRHVRTSTLAHTCRHRMHMRSPAFLPFDMSVLREKGAPTKLCNTQHMIVHMQHTCIFFAMHTRSTSTSTSTSTRTLYDLISTLNAILAVCDDVTCHHILSWRHDNLSCMYVLVHVYECISTHITSRQQHVIQYDILACLQHMMRRGWEDAMGMHDTVTTSCITSPSYVDVINNMHSTTTRTYPRAPQTHAGTCIRTLAVLMRWSQTWDAMLARCSQRADNTAASTAAHAIGPTQWRALIALITPSSTSTLPTSTPSFRPTISKLTRAKAQKPQSIEEQLTALIDLFNASVSHDFGYDLLMANDGESRIHSHDAQTCAHHTHHTLSHTSHMCTCMSICMCEHVHAMTHV